MKLKIAVMPAGKKGRGVFAIKNIKKGEVIEIAPYIQVPKEYFKQLSGSFLEDYWYEGHSTDFPTVIGLGYTSMYNHDKKPSAEFILNLRTKTIKFTALRKIVAGEEITVDYGYDPLA